MGTPALVQMANPGGAHLLAFRVHYDGGASTGEALRSLIARDGYDTVYRTIEVQCSRFWVGLDASLQTMPDYVSSYPKAWEVALVQSYGLLFVGPEEREYSTDMTRFDPDVWDGIIWSISPVGKVSGGIPQMLTQRRNTRTGGSGRLATSL